MTDVIHIQLVYVSASIAVFSIWQIKRYCINKYIGYDGEQENQKDTDGIMNFRNIFF